MAALPHELLEDAAQRLHREVVTAPGLAPRMILAIEAAQRAVREEDRAGAARAADRRLLAEVRAVAEDARQQVGLAVACLAGEAVDTARARAKAAGMEV